MPYPSALVSGDYTRRRGGIKSVVRYAVVHTPTVIFQCNPSTNADGTSASTISYTAALAGDAADVCQYMSVYITPTSDYQQDLVQQPENCHRNFARLDPTADTIHINHTAFQWTTSSYVTIVDNFEVYEKKALVDSGTIYKNSTETYRAPLPRIDDLYHDVVVIASGTTYDYSPTPSEEAMASGATISSRSWATIENGTVTKAASTSATPTFTLDAGTHWLHLTTTDSNGNTNVTVAFIAVIPSDYSSTLTTITPPTVTRTLGNGNSAEVEAIDDSNTQISNLVPGTFGAVFAVVNYKDDTTAVLVECTGWYDAPTQITYTADDQSGFSKAYRTSLLGIRQVMERISLPAFPYQYDASPSTWGEVARCTVYDAVWFHLSEHSTVTQVAAIDLPSSYTDYQYNPAIDIPSGTLANAIDALAFRASMGGANYPAHGEIVFEQAALYKTSGRDSLTTYGAYDIAENDALFYDMTRPSVNRFTLSSVEGGYATFNTSSNTPRIYRSVAPANQASADLFEQHDGVIMTKNLSNAQALAEAGKLTANAFFASNESLELQADFVAGYLEITPSNHHWHTFAIPATYLLDGGLLDSNTRFICTSVSSRFDVTTMSMTVSATFREETDGGDNYARETEFVPSSNEQVHSVYPLGTFSPFLSDFDIGSASDTYGDDFDDYTEGIEDPTLPPEEAAKNQSKQPGVIEVLYIPLRGGAINSSFNSTLGASYIIRLSGSGSLGGTNWCYNFDFTSSDGSWTTRADDSRDHGVYTPSTGWVSEFEAAGGINDERLYIERDFTATYVTSFSVTMDVSGNGGGGRLITLQAKSGGSVVATTSTVYANATNGQTFSLTVNATVDEIEVTVVGDVASDGVVAYTITSSQVQGTGTNPFGTSNCGAGGDEIFGDALFYFVGDSTGTAYSGQGGVNIDGAGIVHAESYNAAHSYEVSFTGTGNPIALSFVDTVDSDLANNENTFIKAEILQ